MNGMLIGLLVAKAAAAMVVERVEVATAAAMGAAGKGAAKAAAAMVVGRVAVVKVVAMAEVGRVAARGVAARAVAE
jgi:hypothetical protein